eukprot:2373108-Prymnesium_polylepis.1
MLPSRARRATPRARRQGPDVPRGQAVQRWRPLQPDGRDARPPPGQAADEAHRPPARLVPLRSWTREKIRSGWPS